MKKRNVCLIFGGHADSLSPEILAKVTRKERCIVCDEDVLLTGNETEIIKNGYQSSKDLPEGTKIKYIAIPCAMDINSAFGMMTLKELKDHTALHHKPKGQTND